MNQITEATIRRYADARSFARGQEYYDEGAVVSLVRRGDTLQAEVEGSDPEPYSVSVTFTADGEIAADCDCPYEWGGWCKHIVAALLCYMNEPEEAEERPTLETLLSPLDREALHALLLNLARRKPELTDDIEAEIERLKVKPAQPAAVPAAPPHPAPVDPAPIRRQVRAALKSVARGGYDYWDDTGGLDDITEAVETQVEIAEAFLQAGDGRGALPVLEAITDELVEGWDLVEDMVGDMSDLFGELGGAWAEAILSADLTDEERNAWAAALNRWRRKHKYSGAEGGLEVAVVAAQQGWDYPPLVRVLQGEITDKGAWEGKVPDCADELAVARLNVLERQGRLQEAAYLAEAESQYDRYMSLLVRLGRAQEAVDFGMEVLTTASSALELAKALHAQGETALVFRVAEHGLGLQGPCYTLATWLRDAAREQGDADRAIRAAMAAIKESPRLGDYRQLQDFAGDQWPKLREEILARLRQSEPYDVSGKVDIFLYEGLMEDALDAVRKNSGNYDLVARVCEAATATHPQEVIPICEGQAEAIMDAGKADRYDHAARWVARARDAYRAAGMEAEWQTYKRHLLDTHQRKYKLVPLLKDL